MAAPQPISTDDRQRIEAAPAALRLLALLIDGLIVVLPLSLIPASAPLTLEEGITAVMAGALIIPIRFLPVVFILTLLEWRTGKTVGKFLLGIRVTGVEDGESIGLIRSIGRRAIMVLESYIFFIPSLILVPFNRGFDGHLGDRLTGAIVTRDSDIDRTSADHPGQDADPTWPHGRDAPH